MGRAPFKAKDTSTETWQSKSRYLVKYCKRLIFTSTFRPRLVRIISPINTSVHDLVLVDSPKFHIVFDFAENLEVYHLTIRGANLGSYDGVDVVGTNYWIHDIEVRISQPETN